MRMCALADTSGPRVELGRALMVPNADLELRSKERQREYCLKESTVCYESTEEKDSLMCALVSFLFP